MSNIPVPIKSDFFQGGNPPLSRTWILWFESLMGAAAAAATDGGAPAGGPVYQRTLLLKNTAVGNDIADWISVYQPGTAFAVVAVLRKAITSILTVRINQNKIPLIVCSLDSTVVPGHVLRYKTFLPPSNGVLKTDDVLSWDITASDGSSDANGIAALSILWS